MSYGHVAKSERSGAKHRKRLRKRARRQRRKNAKAVTEEYGKLAMRSCGRKNRYDSERVAREKATMYSVKTGREISYYRCALCDGWHLTSHPRGRKGIPLRASEVFERSRAAARRMMQIDADMQELDDRVGPQGHSYERAPKNDIRDPMRHVDERIDGVAELEREKVELMADIREAQRLIWGFSRFDDCDRATGDGEYVMTEYYVYGRSMPDIARRCGMREDLCTMLIRECVSMCDKIGIARLRRPDESC